MQAGLGEILHRRRNVPIGNVREIDAACLEESRNKVVERSGCRPPVELSGLSAGECDKFTQRANVRRSRHRNGNEGVGSGGYRDEVARWIVGQLAAVNQRVARQWASVDVQESVVVTSAQHGIDSQD